MAVSNQRFRLAAILFPFLFLAMSGFSRATEIDVDTLSSGHVDGACSLSDAFVSVNTFTSPAGSTCAVADGVDTIGFSVTGTISVDATLEVDLDEQLTIVGPTAGGIVLEGDGVEILNAENNATTDSLTIQNLTFTDGFAGPTSSGEGGAIFANGTLLKILDCLFVDNEAEHTAPGGKGGAIFVNSAGEVDITNSTLTENMAAGSGSVGGAIADMNTSSTLKLTNVTIASNSAAAGGGYASMVKPLAKGSIFASNPPQNCATVTVTNVGTANISSDSSCGATHVENPLLDPAGLKNNGGPTETIALESTSPAINLIPVADCTDQETTPQPLKTDQRLYGRPDPLDLSTCDSGAYEFGAVPAIALETSPGPKVQIARSGSPMSDQVNENFTFTDNGIGGSCNAGNDALNGVEIGLLQGTCAALPSIGLFDPLDPFVVHMIGSEAYGTFYATDSLGAVSARIVQVSSSATPPCGEWTLNIENSGLDTATFGLTGGSGPGTTYALYIEDADLNTGCFDVTNAIVGTQVPPPGVPRLVRRETRR